MAQTGTYKAIYAFDESNIELPIKKTYVSFATNENSVSFFDDENEECCKRTKVEIKANFYSPPSDKTIDTYTLAETLLDYRLKEHKGSCNNE